MSFAFEYEFRNTFIHRLHPLTKFIIFLVFLILASLYLDPLYHLLLLVVVLPFIYISKVSLRSLIPITAFFIIMTLPMDLLAIWMYDPSFFKVYPQEVVSTPVLHIFPPGTPIVGEAILTIGGLIFMSGFMMRMANITFIFSFFTYTTSPSNIIQYLLKKGVPTHVVFPVYAAYRLTPIIKGFIENVMSAQILRGAEYRSRNPLKVFKEFVHLTYPLMRLFVFLPDQIGMAAVIRGFGLGKSSYFRDIKMSKKDVLISIFSILISMTALLGLFLFNMGAL